MVYNAHAQSTTAGLRGPRRPHGGRRRPRGQPERPHPRLCASVLDPQELADLIAYADDMTLDDEIACARVALRRVLVLLETPAVTRFEACPEPSKDLAMKLPNTRSSQVLAAVAGIPRSSLLPKTCEPFSRCWFAAAAGLHQQVTRRRGCLSSPSGFPQVPSPGNAPQS